MFMVAKVFANRTERGYRIILKPILFSAEVEINGVAPPSIMFATRGALIALPIFFHFLN